MTWPVLAAIVATLVVLALVGIVTQRARRRRAELLERFDSGRPATATIDEAEPRSGLGQRVQGKTAYEVHVTVSPPHGGPYTAITGLHTDPAHADRLAPGKTLRVRVDRDNREMVFPDVPWAEMSGDIIRRAARRG